MKMKIVSGLLATCLLTSMPTAAIGLQGDALTEVRTALQEISPRINCASLETDVGSHLGAPIGLQLLNTHYNPLSGFLPGTDQFEKLYHLKWTPLHYLAAYDKVDALNRVLDILAEGNEEDKALVNKGDIINRTPLLIATHYGKAEVVNALLNKEGLTIDANKDSGGFTPLFIAADSGRIDIVNALLNKEGLNLDVYKAKNDGATPLFVAAQQGHLDVVNAILAKDATGVYRPMNNGATPLFVAAQQGHLDVVNAILAKDATGVDRPMNNGVAPLFMAASRSQQSPAGDRQRYINVIDSLIRNGANCNTAKECADKLRQPRVVETFAITFNFMPTVQITEVQPTPEDVELAQYIDDLIEERKRVVAAEVLDQHNRDFTVDDIREKQCSFCWENFENKFPELFGENIPTLATMKERIFKFNSCNENVGERCQAFVCKECAMEYLLSLPKMKYRCPVCNK